MRAALAHRISRFLRGLELAKRCPNRRETYYVIEAIQCLQAARYDDGQDAMFNAERRAPIAQNASPLPDVPMTIEDLRSGLEAVLRQEDPR